MQYLHVWCEHLDQLSPSSYLSSGERLHEGDDRCTKVHTFDNLHQQEQGNLAVPEAQD